MRNVKETLFVAAFILLGILAFCSERASANKHHGKPTPTPSPTATPTATPTPTQTPSPTPLPTPPSVTLAWDADIDPTVDGYNLWMGFASGQETEGAGLGIVTTTTVQLTSGTTYYFVVTAHNSNGDSLPSNEVSYTAP